MTMHERPTQESLTRRVAGSAAGAIGRGYLIAERELKGKGNDSTAQPGLATEAFPTGAVTGTDGRLLTPATRRKTSQEAAVVVATPAKRDRVVTETVHTAPKADSRSVNKTPRRQRREAGAAYAANEVIAAEEDRDNHGNNRRGNWTAVSGFAIAGAILFAATRGNGGAPIAFATSSPSMPPSGPESFPPPTASPTAQLKDSAAPSETTRSINQLDVQTLIKLLQADPKNIHASDYTLTFGNWSIVYGDNTTRYPGAVMAIDNATGQAHLVSTLNTSELKTVGQGYTDGMVPGKDKAISWVLAPGTYMPLKQITEWPVQPGQTSGDATAQALKGQADLEARTQPLVCTLTVTESLQAISENTQDLSNAPQWQPDTSMTADEVAAKYGVSGLATDGSKWHRSADGYGWTLDVDQTGASSIVSLPDAVGQAYVDDINPDSNGHNVVAVSLGVGTKAPVRQITLYIGVPKGMEQEVLDYVFKQHVNKELGLFNPNDAQIGVYVVKVPETICPIGPTSKAEQSAAIARATAEIANAHWYDGFVKQFGSAVKPLTNGTNGIVITEKTPVTVTLSDGQVMDYWDGKTSHTAVPGPLTVKGVLIGTIYPHK